jgi:hypothetical protein
MIIAPFPTLAQALQSKADGAGWRGMDVAPRRADGSEYDPEPILARSEHDEDVEVVWAIAGEPGAGGWRRSKGEASIIGRLVAWRPIVQYREPEERTMAASLAMAARIGAEKAERMARFLPQEAEKARQLRAEEERYAAIAKGGR